MSPGALLEPVRFGDGRCLPCRLVPGPMDGVTEGSFVSVLSRLGLVWSWHTPLLRISTGVPSRTRLRSALRPYLETGLPVTVQLMGLDAGRLAATAARVLDLGAVCADLNCACPSHAHLRRALHPRPPQTLHQRRTPRLRPRDGPRRTRPYPPAHARRRRQPGLTRSKKSCP